MNKVILIGRLTEDPKIKHTSTSAAVLNFTLAVRRKIPPANGPDADFIRCTAWNKTAGFVQKHFSKGDSIGVLGELHNNRYADKNGEVKYSVNVNVEEVYMTGSSMRK